MNNKLMFVFGFIAVLIVALAFSSVSAKWFGKSAVQFAPNETNANDCSADEKCLMKNAVVSGDVSARTGNLQSLTTGNVVSTGTFSGKSGSLNKLTFSPQVYLLPPNPEPAPPLTLS